MTVTTDVFAWTTFCDDVRREEGNKLSFLGIYATELFLPSFPVQLPKLCFVMTVRVPVERELHSLLFRLYRDDELISEAAAAPAALQRPMDLPAGDDAPTWVLVTNVLQMFPIQFTAPCAFRVVAVVDGEEVKAGKLRVKAAPATAG